MPTKLRVIYVYASQPYGGRDATNFLEYVSNRLLIPVVAHGSMHEAQRLVEIYKKIPRDQRGVLFLFREPRRVSRGRSRWKQLAAHYRIPIKKQEKKKKSVFVRERVPASPRNARAVQGTVPPREVVTQPFWDAPLQATITNTPGIAGTITQQIRWAPTTPDLMPLNQAVERARASMAARQQEIEQRNEEVVPFWAIDEITNG